MTENGATVLGITPRDGAPTLTPSPTPAWGLHLLDANIALGNLVSVVRSETSTYQAEVHHPPVVAAGCACRTSGGIIGPSPEGSAMPASDHV
jgi:hypothetical protein